MNVGIFDQDALLYPKKFRFNLEVMKLASYYKSKRDITTLLLDANDYERFSKIIIRKDKFDNKFPTFLINQKRTEYGGLAFTNNIYVPLEEEIENLIPDISIYNNYLKHRELDRSHKLEKLKSDKIASFLRLSTDNKTCNIDYEKFIIGRHKVLIYDNLIGELKNDLEILREIGKTHSLDFIYPIKLSNSDGLRWWIDNIKIMPYSIINFTPRISNQEYVGLSDLSNQYNGRLSFIFSQTKIFNESFFIQELILILRRMIYSKTKNQKIKFYYERSIPKGEEQKTFTMLEAWNNTHFNSQSFLEYCKGSPLRYNYLIELQKKYPQLYSSFNTSPDLVRKKGGILSL